MEEDYNTYDINSYLGMLEDVWRLMPEASFADVLGQVFDGYDLKQLSEEEQIEMMKDFLFNNM